MDHVHVIRRPKEFGTAACPSQGKSIERLNVHETMHRFRQMIGK
jgi:hypothetical protein